MLNLKFNITNLFFVIILLGACSTPHHITKVDGQLVQIKDVGSDQELKTIIAPYKEQLDKEMNEVIGFSEVAMDKGKPEGLLGNFLADLLLEISNKNYESDQAIDFCVINNGGLRTSIPKGDITRKKVFELMPFENELVVITLSKESTDQLFSYLAKKGGGPISGFILEIGDDGNYKAFSKNKTELKDKNYKILTSDYLADGGSSMTFFADSLKREVLGLKVRDAILQYVITETKAGRTLNTQLDKRIYYAK